MKVDYLIRERVYQPILEPFQPVIKVLRCSRFHQHLTFHGSASTTHTHKVLRILPIDRLLKIILSHKR